jgi:hypothetical protein
MGDRSLDEFLDAGDGDPTDGKPADGPDDGKRETDVDPVTATYAWDPGGGTCPRCGTTVGRRWRGEAGLVCDDCKEW